MDVPVHVRVAHVRRVQAVQPVGTVHRGKDVVVQPLEREGHVRVLVHAPVEVLQVALDQFVRVDQGADVPQFVVQIPVEDEGLGRLGVAVLDQHALDDVLDLLHRGDGVHLKVEALEHVDHGVRDVGRALAVVPAHRLRRLEDRRRDLVLVKGHQATVALADHTLLFAGHDRTSLSAEHQRVTENPDACRRERVAKGMAPRLGAAGSSGGLQQAAAHDAPRARSAGRPRRPFSRPDRPGKERPATPASIAHSGAFGKRYCSDSRANS